MTEYKRSLTAIGKFIFQLVKITHDIPDVDEVQAVIPPEKLHRHLKDGVAGKEAWRLLHKLYEDTQADLVETRASIRLAWNTDKNVPNALQQLHFTDRMDKREHAAIRRLNPSAKDLERGGLDLGAICPDLPADVQRAAWLPCQGGTASSEPARGAPPKDDAKPRRRTDNRPRQFSPRRDDG